MRQEEDVPVDLAGSSEQGLELLGHLLQGVVQFQLLGIQLENEIESNMFDVVEKKAS